MNVLLILVCTLFSSAYANSPESWTDVAKSSGWDVVASQLSEEVSIAKNEKKRTKRLQELGLHALTMPVRFMTGAELVFSSATKATSCRWEDNVVCTFTVKNTAPIEPEQYRALCTTQYSTAAVLTSTFTGGTEQSTQWTIGNVEECWALNGHTISLAPVGDKSLDGIGQGDDFLPPELVALSWRETEEIIRAKVPIFRFCQQSLPEDHPSRSGQLEVRYTIAESGAIDHAEIERATFTDSTLTDCVLERFKRIHIRPPLGGWTGGTFTLSFGK